MLSNYVIFLVCALIGKTLAQTSNTGKISSSSGTDSTPNQGSSDPQTNTGYQFNQGIQPYSYGYNTGIRPYSYTYTYPQNGGKPQITYQNLQQPQYQGMVPMQPAPYFAPNGGYPMQPGYYGYPMQPVQFQPINGPPPTIPPMPELPNLGGDFDITNLGPTSNSNNANNANANNNAVSNGLQTSDLNSELANLADPSSVSGGSNNANNNAGVPQSLSDFNIDGLSSNPTTSTNNNNNNNNNNPLTGLPDILNQINGNSNNQNDFADLTNLANLANGVNINQAASAQQNNQPTSPTDFNFGGSNNNLDFDINNLPSASNLDLNIPSPSELKPQKIKSNKEIATVIKNKKQYKKDKNYQQSNHNNKQIEGKKLVKNRRRRSTTENEETKKAFLTKEPLVTAESFQTQNDLQIDPESPRAMLNVNPAYQNPYQGVYSQYPGSSWF